MKNKIGIKYKEIFLKCQGNCQDCISTNDCQLQKIIKKYGLSHIKNLVYNENEQVKINNTFIKRGVGRPKKKKRRGRPRKIKQSSEQTLKEANSILGKGKHGGFVYIKCIRCNKEDKIHTNNKELYTEEVRKNWKCIFCK